MRPPGYFSVFFHSVLAFILIGSIACGGGLQNQVKLAEPSYSITLATLSPNSIAAGKTATSTITLTSVNSYAAAVGLSCAAISGTGPVPTCSFSVNPVNLAANGQATSTLTVSTAATTPVGTYAIKINAQDTRKVVPSDGPQSLTLTVSGIPSYSIDAASPSPGSITAGENSSSSITVASANGYAGNVNLSCGAVSGSGPVPTCSFSPNPVLLSANGQATSTLTLSTTTSTPGGSYTVTINAQDDNQNAPANGNQTFSLTTAGVIQRVVIIFQENRTPDNLFQDPVLIARGADIAGSGTDSTGQVIELSPINLGTNGSSPQNYDLGHTHYDFKMMYHGGKMDGADKVTCFPSANCTVYPHPQFMYVQASDVLPYFSLAEQYTFGDRMFQTNEGPSFPAHQASLAVLEQDGGHPYAGRLRLRFVWKRRLHLDSIEAQTRYPGSPSMNQVRKPKPEWREQPFRYFGSYSHQQPLRGRKFVIQPCGLHRSTRRDRGHGGSTRRRIHDA